MLGLDHYNRVLDCMSLIYMKSEYTNNEYSKKCVRTTNQYRLKTLSDDISCFLSDQYFK